MSFTISATVSAAAVATLLAAGAAVAGPINPAFTPNSPNERLEFVGNGSGSAWSIGLGTDTQNSAFMANTQGLGTIWTPGVTETFTFAIDGAGNASFTMDPVNLEPINLTFGTMGLGNTLQLHAKRGGTLTVNGTTVTGDPNDPWGADYAYLPLNGPFSITGEITFGDLNGSIPARSQWGVTATVGNITGGPGSSQIPVPASAAVLTVALAGFAVSRSLCRA